MGIYLNPDNLAFQKSLNARIYVDKSMLIKNTNQVINTNEGFVCVSRPRRFGKTIAADMLTAYYSRGCSSNKMFAGLKISKTDDYEKNLNQYNVIHLNMDEFLSKSKDTIDMTDKITKSLIKEIKKEYPVFKNEKWKYLEEAFLTVFSEIKIPFVFIIDEWDCVMRKYKNKNKEHEKYLDFLKLIFKDKNYAALVYMTGILPIKKYGMHSALNMFNEISIIEADEYSEFTGFTEEEVKELCKKYNMNFNEEKRWYNGYNVMEKAIYNPRSVVMSLTKHRIGNFWTSTETYEALTSYIEMNFDGLKDAVAKLLAGEKIKVKTSKFTNDMVTFKSRDDVLTLLIHLGYLTYDIYKEEAWIPNKEVFRQFTDTVEEMQWNEVSKSLLLSNELLKETLKCNEERVAELIDEVHSDNTSILKYNDENSLACVISIAYYAAREYYDIYRELPSGKGFADLVFVPRQEVSLPPIIIELKFDNSAETAIEQIKNRRYSDFFKNYKGEIILAGINYLKSDPEKKHECKIEKVKN